MRRRAQPWLGTLVEIAIGDTLSEQRYADCFGAAFAGIAEIHGLMSFHASDSDVTRINRSAIGATLRISPLTYTVLRQATLLAGQTGGVFNIGCARQLVDWDILPGDNVGPRLEPEPDDYARAGNGAGLPIAMLALEPANTVRRLAPGPIDLGGIAKGYAVDQAIGVLQRLGVEAAIVNAGGDLRVIGPAPFPVAIRDPDAPAHMGWEGTLLNQALATSSTYFSRRRHGAKEVSALVHGQTGQPLTSRASASVRSASCMVADALTKLVLASGDAQHPLLRQYGAEAILLHGQLHSQMEATHASE